MWGFFLQKLPRFVATRCARGRRGLGLRRRLLPHDDGLLLLEYFFRVGKYYFPSLTIIFLILLTFYLAPLIIFFRLGKQQRLLNNVSQSLVALHLIHPPRSLPASAAEIRGVHLQALGAGPGRPHCQKGIHVYRDDQLLTQRLKGLKNTTKIFLMLFIFLFFLFFVKNYVYFLTNSSQTRRRFDMGISLIGSQYIALPIKDILPGFGGVPLLR